MAPNSRDGIPEASGRLSKLQKIREKVKKLMEFGRREPTRPGEPGVPTPDQTVDGSSSTGLPRRKSPAAIHPFSVSAISSAAR